MNVSETYKLPPEPAVGTVLKDVETGEYTVEDPADFLAKLETELRRLAAENPTYVYRSAQAATSDVGDACFYVAGENHDACIYGQALANLGVPEKVLSRADRSYLIGAGIGIRTLLGWIGVNRCDERFSRVQDRQDRGHSWQSAVAALDD